MPEVINLTIMLSFYVLIGLYKVPELLLALLCQELTEEEEEDYYIYLCCLCKLCLNFQNLHIKE